MPKKRQQLTNEHLTILYALSTLKLPSTQNVAKLLDKPGSIMRDRIVILENHNLVNKRLLSASLAIFLLSEEGRKTLRAFLKSNPKPNFNKKVVVEKVYDSLMSQPRTFIGRGSYETPKNTYYRNDGNKHILSRGFQC